MSRRTRPAVPGLLFVAALAALAGQAHAACTSPTDFRLTVGNPDKDHACQFSSVQAAIDAAHCAGTTIVISQTVDYNAQKLTVNSKDLLLYGSASCSDKVVPTPGPQVLLNGAGNGGSSVLAVNGRSNVALQNLLLSGSQGDASDLGGGIYFDGDGSLTLADVTITGNAAGFGGGVYIKGEHFAGLVINANTLIESNTAYHDGGGIYLDEHTSITMTGANTSVLGNTAVGVNATAGKSGLATDGYGGGIMASRAASLDLSAGGVLGLGGQGAYGAIEGNHALRGGGIAFVALDTCWSYALHIAAPDATHPFQISNNHASIAGGALYFKPSASHFIDFCPNAIHDVGDLRIAGNSASDGAAVYLDWDTAYGFIDVGTSFKINYPGYEENADQIADDPKFARSITCRGAPGCDVIENNTAADDTGKQTKGSIVFVGISGEFWANRVTFRHNVADNLIYIRGDNDYDEGDRFENALIEGNTFKRAVITQEHDDAPVTIDSSTIAGNTIGGKFVILAHSPFTLTDSLLGDDRAALSFSGGSSNLHVANVIAVGVEGLPHVSSVLSGDPGFRNPAAEDFTLADGSRALDFAPVTPALPYDIAGRVRNADLPDVADSHGGYRDLGAFERSANVAAAIDGAVASGSTEGPTFPAAAAINGDRTGAGWPNNAGWRDDTRAQFPDSLQVLFPVPRSIDRIVVTTLQDDYMNPVEPDATLTFTQFGVTDFDLQVLDPVTMNWVTKQSVTGNHNVQRTFAFALTQALGVRIICYDVPDHLYARIVELEAFGG